jgi:AcrR family transcriptional regulator
LPVHAVDSGSGEFYRDRVTRSVEPVTSIDARLERVLDAAADLLVRLGYRRVTIEEVARRAGIGKGTVYLHFPTKEALFLAVLLRTHHGVQARIVARMEADAAEVLPGRLARSLYLDVAADPVTRPLYLGDAEVLGRLAHESVDTLGDLSRRRQDGARAWMGLLRDAGLVRTDHDVDTQLYLLSTINSGFYFVDALPVPGAPADPAGRAELLEHVVSAVLEVPGADERAAAVAPAVADLYRTLIDHIDEEWRRRLR